jgi:hypothetical protein
MDQDLSLQKEEESYLENEEAFIEGEEDEEDGVNE